MMNIEDIPKLKDRKKRFEEILVDCYGEAEEMSAMEVYFTDAAQFPFEAEWRDPDEDGHAEAVMVLGVANTSDRRGILLKVKRASGKERRVLADQLWAKAKRSANAVILDDYREWAGTLEL